MDDDIYRFAYLLMGSIASLEPSEHQFAREIHNKASSWRASKVVQDGDVLLYNLGTSYCSFSGAQSIFALATIDDLKNIPQRFYNAMIPPQTSSVPQLTLKCTDIYASKNDLKKDEEPIELCEGLILGHNKKGFEKYLPYPGVQNPHPEYSNPSQLIMPPSFFMQSPDSIEEGIERLKHLEERFAPETRKSLEIFLGNYKKMANDAIQKSYKRQRNAYW